MIVSIADDRDRDEGTRPHNDAPTRGAGAFGALHGAGQTSEIAHPGLVQRLSDAEETLTEYVELRAPRLQIRGGGGEFRLHAGELRARGDECLRDGIALAPAAVERGTRRIEDLLRGCEPAPGEREIGAVARDVESCRVHGGSRAVDLVTPRDPRVRAHARRGETIGDHRDGGDRSQCRPGSQPVPRPDGRGGRECVDAHAPPTAGATPSRTNHLPPYGRVRCANSRDLHFRVTRR